MRDKLLDFISTYNKSNDIPFEDLTEPEQMVLVERFIKESNTNNVESVETATSADVTTLESSEKETKKEKNSSLTDLLAAKKSKKPNANIVNTNNELSKINYDTKSDDLLKRSDYEWRSILAKDICVFKTSSGKYVYREYDKISYSKCINFEKTLIPAIKRNVEMLLRYKYFNDVYINDNILSNPELLNELDKRMLEINKSFTNFLESSINKVDIIEFTDESNSESSTLKKLPDYAIAFNDGVYDFKHNDWLFKYNKIKTRSITGDDTGTIIEYENKSYIIGWHINVNWGDLIDVYNSIMQTLGYKSICDVDIKKLFDFFRSENMFDINTYNKKGKRIPNYAITFALINNMSHNEGHFLSEDKLIHLCQIMGYSLKNSFDSHFIYFIGSGGNGKDSLITGSFLKFLDDDSYTTISIADINNDKFATSNLVDSHINVYMENSTTNAVIKELQVLKALTGGNSVTVEAKGQQKIKVDINARIISAANNKDDLKFSDSSDGLIRRINMCEIFYTWDSEGKYLNKGDKDFYNVNYSEDFYEIRNDKSNLLTYIMFGMAGLSSATNKFTSRKIRFIANDWSSKYIDLDMEVRDLIDNLTLKDLYEISFNPKYKDLLNGFACDTSIYHNYLSSNQARSRSEFLNKNDYYLSIFGKNEFIYNVIKEYVDPEDDDKEDWAMKFFNEFIDFYIPVELIQGCVDNTDKVSDFVKLLKKYFKGNIIRVERNREKRYVIKVRIINDSIIFID